MLERELAETSTALKKVDSYERQFDAINREMKKYENKMAEAFQKTVDKLEIYDKKLDDVFVDAQERERAHSANLKLVENSNSKINDCLENIQTSKDLMMR